MHRSRRINRDIPAAINKTYQAVVLSVLFFLTADIKITQFLKKIIFFLLEENLFEQFKQLEALRKNQNLVKNKSF